MSKADYSYLKTANSILKGCWETGEVRPKWEDGTPAYAIKKFAVCNLYNLSEEFPITSIRNTNWRGAIDEMMWIWVKKSNNINDLHSNVWNQWADDKGSIGEAYGAQVRKVSHYKEGDFDQIDRILYQLKNDPSSRRILAELYNPEDLNKMYLSPCVHGLNFVVTDGNKLNLVLNQRSNDTLAAGNWNVIQYAALVHMLAQVSGMQVGELAHVVADAHIYDRHIPFIIDITFSRAKEIQAKLKDERVCEIVSAMNLPEIKEKFERFQDEILTKEANYDPALTEAQNYERIANDCQNKLISTEEMRKYQKKIVDTFEFQQASKIVDTMYENPIFDQAFGYKEPKLVLDKNVKNFYNFISPKTKDKNGKNINNPNSSFNVEDYYPEKEGIKLQAKVPVAE